jgi:hypothetical protein
MVSRSQIRGSDPATLSRTMSPLGRALILLVVTAVLLAGAGTAPVANAHTSGGNATGGGQWHPWTSDACSKVPNWSPGFFNFTHACQHHDGCYRGHWASRSTCDRWFYNDMRASCRTSSTLGVMRTRCYQVALLYYTGVIALGHGAYKKHSHVIPLSGGW